MGLDPDVLRRIIEARIELVWTALPARVDSYDAGAQTVACTPTVRRPLATEEDDDLGVKFADLPSLPAVPVVFPRGGACAITWPLSPGDHVLLVVSTFDPSGWRSDGIVSDPGFVLAHYLNGAFAIPGIAALLSPIAPKQSTAPALVLDGPEIRLTADADSPTDDFIALAKKVETALDSICSAAGGAGSGDAVPAALSALVGTFDVKSAKVKST